MLHPLVRRLLRPGGLLLVAGCFLLPFVTVSCSPAASSEMSPSGSSGPPVTVTYAGTDLAAGARPSVWWSGDAQNIKRDLQFDPVQEVPRLGVQPFVIVALVLVLAGVATGALRSRWARDLAGAATAVLGAIFLAGAELLALHAAHRRVQEEVAMMGLAANPTPNPAPQVDGLFKIAPGYGFWLALVLLLAIGTVSVVQLMRQGTRAADPVPPAPAVAS